MRLIHRGIRKTQFQESPNRNLTTAQFRIIVDTREQHPWTFTNLEADKKQGGGLLYVRLCREALRTGDYSIDGYQEKVTVERKSIEDLVQTLTTGRERFKREHERMADMGVGNAVCIVEGAWGDIWSNSTGSRMLPKTIHRTAFSWFEKYGVPWFFCGSRRWAEESAFRYLEKWFQHNEVEEKTPNQTLGNAQ